MPTGTRRFGVTASSKTSSTRESTCAGNSPQLRTALVAARQLGAGREQQILLLGEVGTGIKSLARAIHRVRMERVKTEGPFVELNCGAVLAQDFVATLNQFFLEKARGGTLYLRDPQRLPPQHQEVLRELIEKHQLLAADGQAPLARGPELFLFAIHHKRDELDLALEQLDRELYYRTEASCVRLPPLRERREDIPALVLGVLGQSQTGVALGVEASAWLCAQAWPGNALELVKCVEAAAERCLGTTLSVADLEERQPSGVGRDANLEAGARRTLLDNARRIERIMEDFQQHPAPPSLEQVKAWLYQFREPPQIELALLFLQNIKFETQKKLSEKILSCLKRKNLITPSGTVYAPMGHLKDSGVEQTYHLGHGELPVVPLTLEEAAQRHEPDEIEQIVLLDDLIGGGTQAGDFLRGWLGQGTDPRCPELTSKAQTLLLSKPVRYVVALAFQDGVAEVEKCALSLGIDLNVEVACPHLDPEGCFDSRVIGNRELRAAARALAEEIGRELWTEEGHPEWALGRGGNSQLIVIDTRPPTCTLPLLWKRGRYRGAPWLPLFPRK